MCICSTIYRVQWSHQFPHIFLPTAANRTCTQHLSEHLADNAHLFHRVVIISPIVRIATNWVHTPFSDSNPHKSQDHSMRAEADTQGMFVLPCCRAHRLRLLVSLVRGYRETEAGKASPRNLWRFWPLRICPKIGLSSNQIWPLASPVNRGFNVNIHIYIYIYKYIYTYE